MSGFVFILEMGFERKIKQPPLQAAGLFDKGE
jgi:hypothetical protein